MADTKCVVAAHGAAPARPRTRAALDSECSVAHVRAPGLPMRPRRTGDGDITGGGDVKVPPGGSDSKHDDVAITIRQKKVGFNFSNDEDMDGALQCGA